MVRKYFAFENGVDSPETEAALEAITTDYTWINDDDDGAPETIYACDAEIETPEALLPFMYYSPSTDERLDKEIAERQERRKAEQEKKAAKPKMASQFFEYCNLGEMGVFIEQTLKTKTVQELNQLSVKFNAANGCTLYYPAVHPLSKKREETGWTDEDGGRPTSSIITYDAHGGIVDVEADYSI